MRERPRVARRILAIDPATRGFAFALLDRGRLEDWGRRLGDRRADHDECLTAIERLLVISAPRVLALEDCAAASSHRCARVRRLLTTASRLASRRGVAVARIAPDEARRACTGREHATKAVVVQTLADRFPELRAWVPRQRKAWMSEDPRMNVFDAVTLAIGAAGETSPVATVRSPPSRAA